MMAAANTMNERPISVRVCEEWTFQPITVNQLLLGRGFTNVQQMEYPERGPLERLAFKEELERVWRGQFSVQVLPALIPVLK